MNNVSLPKSISPCPIKDALVEIRFSANINSNAVFGMIYNKLMGDFPKVENLPILQLPDMVRNLDPNLKYKPYYRISNSNFVVQIGHDVLSIHATPNYVGWHNFSNKIVEILEKIDAISIIQSVDRFAIRYINFFELNIFDYVNMAVSINEESINYKNTILRTEIPQNEYFSILQIANNVMLNDKSGSIIDIETTTNQSNIFFNDMSNIINEAHIKEKELFYTLLKKEFLDTLNPVF